MGGEKQEDERIRIVRLGDRHTMGDCETTGGCEDHYRGFENCNGGCESCDGGL